MKKTKLFLPAVALSLLLSMGLTACNNSQQSSAAGGQSNASQATPTTSAPAQQKIKITAAGNKTTLQIGETVQLTADPAEVTWESSAPAVATVSGGLVTAVSGGEAVITAKKDGYTNGTITITVTRPEANATFDLTTAADHYSADGWWELPSSGGMGFAMQTVTGWNPISQQSSWGQQTDEPAETFIGGFGVGDKETVTFTSSKAIKGELLLNIGNSDEVNLAEIMSIKLNGTAISLAGKTLEAHAGDWGNSLEFSDLSLGQLDLATSNTLVFEFLADTNIFLNEVQVFAGDATIALTAPAAKQQIAVTAEKLDVIEGETVAIQSQTTGLSYVSLDETVATVSAFGVVTGVKVGITNITVKKEGMYSIRVEITVKPKPVAGQIIVEAESAEELADVTPGSFNMSGPSIMQDGGMWGGSEVHSGGAYVMTMGGDSLTLTMKFTAPAAKVMVLSVVGSAPMMGSEAFVLADSMSIKLNGTAITPAADAQFPAPENYQAALTEAVIGDVNVIAGENTLLVEITGSIPSLDCFKLSSK